MSGNDHCDALTVTAMDDHVTHALYIILGCIKNSGAKDLITSRKFRTNQEQKLNALV